MFPRPRLRSNSFSRTQSHNLASGLDNQDNPDDFVDLEQRIDIHYRQAAGQLVASQLAQVTSSSQLDEHVENVRNNTGLPLRSALFAWRDGWLPAGSEFSGRRVAVQIDGGRVRLRENKKQKKGKKRKKGSRPKFDTPWREPKALIIFEFNQQGKMIKKERQPLIDGTLLGPDHLAELVAFHLHRLGVARAASVVFISDGARWIWDRLKWIEKRAGLDHSKTVHVLDFCHAAHHISLALSHLGYSRTVRRKRYVELRKLLHRSRYNEVVRKLTERAKQQQLGEDHDVWTCLHCGHCFFAIVGTQH